MEQILLWLKYLLLGVFQGFTEPIPVSSSGHLVIAQYFMGLQIEGLSFEVIVNFASLLAVLVIYREDLIRLSKNGIKHFSQPTPETKTDFNFILYLIIGTIPAGVLGYLFADTISHYLKRVEVIGGALIVTGIALFLIRNYKGKRSENNLTFKDAIIVGLAQAVALIPGISRSGATIVAAMGLGMNQQTALRFSFLLFIPVSLGGMVLGVNDLISDPNMAQLLIPYIIAFIASFIMSYFSLRWFMGIMEKGKLIYFSIYCFIVGPTVIILSLLF